jgi:hypothetical protein
MALVTNYLDFNPTAVDETGRTIGGFTWWGKTGGKDLYIGSRQTCKPMSFNTWGGCYSQAKLGKWNNGNSYAVTLDLIGAVVAIYINERAQLGSLESTHWWKGTVIGYNPSSGRHTVFFQNYGTVNLLMKNRTFSIEAAPCDRTYNYYSIDIDTNELVEQSLPIYHPARLSLYEKKMYRNKWDYKTSHSGVWHERKEVEKASELKLNNAALTVTSFIRNYGKWTKNRIDLTQCKSPERCEGICCAESARQIVIKIEDIATVPRVCGACGIKATKKCSKCMNIRYCSEECQTTDWKKHKKTCANSV